MDAAATGKSPETLSSRETFYLKIVFPSIWIGSFAIATLTLFLLPDPKPENAFMKWLFLFFTIVGTLFIRRTCMRLKRVRMDDTVLYVSNYKTEIAVPLSNVADVTENRWINIHPVTIQFHSDTKFGSQIVFMPKVRWFAFWSSHPVVEEIRGAVARSIGRGPALN